VAEKVLRWNWLIMSLIELLKIGGGGYLGSVGHLILAILIYWKERRDLVEVLGLLGI